MADRERLERLTREFQAYKTQRETESLRHYYRAHAPVTFRDAMAINGWKKDEHEILSVADRTSIFHTLAILRDEYAAAMLALDEKEPTDER